VRASYRDAYARPPLLHLPRTGLYLVHRRADDQLWCSRPTDEVGQVVLHGSLGSNPKTPAARTPVVRVLPRARCRRGSGNLRSRRATSRRRQQVLALTRATPSIVAGGEASLTAERPPALPLSAASSKGREPAARSAVTVRSPAHTSATSCSVAKRYASITASVQPVAGGQRAVRARGCESLAAGGCARF
jgi:hypothetical protein